MYYEALNEPQRGSKSWLNTSIFYILKKINYAYFLKILQANALKSDIWT